MARPHRVELAISELGLGEERSSAHSLADRGMGSIAQSVWTDEVWVGSQRASRFSVLFATSSRRITARCFASTSVV